MILCVHEMKRLARNAAELMALSATLQSRDIALELLTGPMPGIYDPHGMGSMLFAVLAVAAQLDRDNIREKTLEGQAAAAAKGNHGGRPPVSGDDMLVFARARRARAPRCPRPPPSSPSPPTRTLARTHRWPRSTARWPTTWTRQSRADNLEPRQAT